MPVISPFVGFELPFVAIALNTFDIKGVAGQKIEELQASTAIGLWRHGFFSL